MIFEASESLISVANDFDGMSRSFRMNFEELCGDLVVVTYKQAAAAIPVASA
jgi:hypothetical protein